MSAQSSPVPSRRGNYDLVMAAFVGLLLISNIGATKLIAFGPRVDVGGVQLLPIITDGGAASAEEAAMHIIDDYDDDDED